MMPLKGSGRLWRRARVDQWAEGGGPEVEDSFISIIAEQRKLDDFNVLCYIAFNLMCPSQCQTCLLFLNTHLTYYKHQGSIQTSLSFPVIPSYYLLVTSKENVYCSKFLMSDIIFNISRSQHGKQRFSRGERPLDLSVDCIAEKECIQSMNGC